MASLFDLALDFNVLNDLSNSLSYNEETGEIIDESEAIAELFNSINAELSSKLDNSMRVVKQLESSEDMLDEEIKRLQKRKITLGNRKNLLRELMYSALNASGQKKLKTDLYNFSIRKSESVFGDAVELLPRDLVRIKREADKTKIKEALKAGREVEGYSIKENYSLGVK